MSDQVRGYALVLVAVLFWASIGVIARELYSLDVDPLTITVFRVLFAFGLLLAAFSSRPRRLRVSLRRLPGLALYGLITVAFNYLSYLYALERISVTTAIVLVYTYPALVALLSRLIFKEGLDRRKVLALLLTLIGVFFVAQGYAPERFKLNLPGAALALGTASGIAFYNLFGKRLVRDLDPWVTVFYGFLFGGVLLSGWWLARGGHRLSYPAQAWLLILTLALCASVLGYGLYLKALRHLEVSRAAITATLEPVLASLLAWLVLHERIEPLQALGGALVLGGVLVLQLGRQPDQLG